MEDEDFKVGKPIFYYLDYCSDLFDHIPKEYRNYNRENQYF
jgi:hypothetical protein